MAECTNIELRKAREAKALTRWQLGNMLGVSESTIERWERGEVMPSPDDIDRLGDSVGDPQLWHDWMLSNCESYRKRYRCDEAKDTVNTPMRVMRTRYAMEDLQGLQAQTERDAMDNGYVDDPALRKAYSDKLKAAIAVLAAALQDVG